MVGLFYANIVMKVDAVLDLTADFKCKLRLQKKFAGRKKQLLAQRTVFSIMFLRMCFPKQMQLQRYSRHHSRKADGHKYQDGFLI
jgi:hypothetical protein